MLKRKINRKNVQKLAPRGFEIDNVIENDVQFEVVFRFKEYKNAIYGENKRELFDELVKVRIIAERIEEQKKEEI